jgi:hypothetical protein
MVSQIAEEDRYAREPRADTLAYGPIAGYSPEAFLNTLPEPDFLTSIEVGHGLIVDTGARDNFAENATRVCQRRGVPYRMQGDVVSVQFVWTGDAIVQEVALQPALTALADPRLAPGPGQEFATARQPHSNSRWRKHVTRSSPPSRCSSPSTT